MESVSLLGAATVLTALLVYIYRRVYTVHDTQAVVTSQRRILAPGLHILRPFERVVFRCDMSPERALETRPMRLAQVDCAAYARVKFRVRDVKAYYSLLTAGTGVLNQSERQVMEERVRSTLLMLLMQSPVLMREPKKLEHALLKALRQEVEHCMVISEVLLTLTPGRAAPLAGEGKKDPTHAERELEFIKLLQRVASEGGETVLKAYVALYPHRYPAAQSATRSLFPAGAEGEEEEDEDDDDDMLVDY